MGKGEDRQVKSHHLLLKKCCIYFQKDHTSMTAILCQNKKDMTRMVSAVQAHVSAGKVYVRVVSTEKIWRSQFSWCLHLFSRRWNYVNIWPNPNGATFQQSVCIFFRWFSKDVYNYIYCTKVILIFIKSHKSQSPTFYPMLIIRNIDLSINVDGTGTYWKTALHHRGLSHAGKAIFIEKVTSTSTLLVSFFCG